MSATVLAPPRPTAPWKIALIVIGSAGALAAVSVLAYLFFVGWQTPLAGRDGELVLAIEQLGGHFPGLRFDPAKGKTTKTRYLDFSWSVEHEHQEEAVYLDAEVAVETSPRDATEYYLGQRVTAPAAMRLSGEIALEDRDTLFQWGDSSHFALIKATDGTPVGNLLVARKGRVVVRYLFVGGFFEDRKAVDEALGPWLTRAAGAATWN